MPYTLVPCYTLIFILNVRQRVSFCCCYGNKYGDLSKNFRFSFIHKRRIRLNPHRIWIWNYCKEGRKKNAMNKKKIRIKTLIVRNVTWKILFLTHANNEKNIYKEDLLYGKYTTLFLIHAKVLWTHATHFTHAKILIYAEILWTHATHANHATFLTYFKISWIHPTHIVHAKIWPTTPRTHVTCAIHPI